MNADKNRLKVVNNYEKIIGRNIYSQDINKRECVFNAYKDGKYYSDCSSSVRWAYRKADIGLNNIGGNTAAIYNNNKENLVDVTVSGGHIKNAHKVLRVGDCLMFRGNDTSRPRGIGHIEMVHEINGEEVKIVGHGSGNPSYKVLDKYETQRYGMKSNCGNRGIECVIRIIEDDEFVRITKGSLKKHVELLQKRLNEELKDIKGFKKLTVDGDYGEATRNAVILYWKILGWNKDGKSTGYTAGIKTLTKLGII